MFNLQFANNYYQTCEIQHLIFSEKSSFSCHISFGYQYFGPHIEITLLFLCIQKYQK